MDCAAQPIYANESTGASQGIIEARILVAKFIQHGVNATALKASNVVVCACVPEIMLRNRGDGPFALPSLVNERC